VHQVVPDADLDAALHAEVNRLLAMDPAEATAFRRAMAESL